MKTLYLVRHASSLANAGQHWNDGPASIPLSIEGHAHARSFAENWVVRPDQVVVSPYVRSAQTAFPLAEKFSLPMVTLQVQEFTYWDFKYSQPDTAGGGRRKQVDEFWLRLDPHEKRGGGNAENFVEFIERCIAFRAWVEGADFQTCVRFSHGFFMHAFRALMQGIDLPPPQMMAHLHKTLPAMAYANLEVAEFLFQDGGTSPEGENPHEQR